MWFLLTSKVGRMFAMIGAAIVFIGMVWLKAISFQKNRDKLQDQKDYIDTRKKIDDAVEDSPTNADDARDWLRRRNKSKR